MKNTGHELIRIEMALREAADALTWRDYCRLLASALDWHFPRPFPGYVRGAQR